MSRRKKPEKPTRAASRVQPAGVLLVVVAAFSLVQGWRIPEQTAGIDFYQWWAAGQAAREPGVGNIYSPEERIRIAEAFIADAKATTEPLRYRGVAEYRNPLPTYHSPMLYAAFGAIATGDYEFDYLGYTRLMLFSVLLAVVALARKLGYSKLECVVLVIFLSAWFWPLRTDMEVGNVSSLQLVMVIAYLLNQLRAPSTPRDVLGGAILGVLVVFKANTIYIPALLGLSWLLTQEYRKLGGQLAGATLGGLSALLLTAAYYGRLSIWPDWLATMPLPNHLMLFVNGNWAPARTVQHLWDVRLVGPISAVLLLAAAALVWRRREGLREAPLADVVVVAIACLLCLLATPVAWNHYYGLALPALLLGLRQPRVRGEGVLASVLAGVAVLPLVSSPVTTTAWVTYPHAFASLVSVGMLLLVWLCFRELEPPFAAHPESAKAA